LTPTSQQAAYLIFFEKGFPVLPPIQMFNSKMARLFYFAVHYGLADSHAKR
jgi:hypothetical protein